ncbi:hypothetical protein L915_13575 [Phytophthora nicotianae]|uniref:Uncharacterized protein n=1 Tax=Phytophthora nicotianae TaxID=4792 RepID=W2IJE1_PHYNI|nr:hypothetical protein L915_13575 [Phytophthora nicotianae]ETL34266.1 hypothetical protein L916_13475 [Phytophthora nicotianae]
MDGIFKTNNNASCLVKLDKTSPGFFEHSGLC